MNEGRRTHWLQWLLVFVVVAAAALARGWYLYACADMGEAAAPLHVQDGLQQLRDAPLSTPEEKTAHVAPGYVGLLDISKDWFEDPHLVIRWTQGVLGVITAAFYFLFALRAFNSILVAAIAGLLTALHPFWIINTAEIQDGVLTSFLLGGCLYLGTRAGQSGGPLSGLFFGLFLAGLCLVRAVMLPFALLAMMWFLLHSRHVRKGWFCALLAFLGFANGLAPWMVRNFQAFQRPVPIANSAYYHLWMGNNPQATGGPISESELRGTLCDERLREIFRETNQSRRYDMLSQEVLDEVVTDPSQTLARRLWAGLYFAFGKAWFDERQLAQPARTDDATQLRKLPPWLEQTYEGILHGTMLGMILFGLLGWRWSFVQRRHTRLAALAVVWIPIPYLLSHAEMLSGPRLPLDGALLSFGAFAIAFMIPGMARRLTSEEQAKG